MLHKGRVLGEVNLATPGVHNVVNALAAIAVGMELDIGFEVMADALGQFAGIHRRLELKWDGEIKLVDDYGHHPTEIRATLSALRSMWKGRIIVAFQPHRYSRTKALQDEFVRSFTDADVLLVTEIYAASEERIEGVTGAALAQAIRSGGHPRVIFAPTKEEVVGRVAGIAASGDMVVTLGAGDIYKVGEELSSTMEPQGITGRVLRNVSMKRYTSMRVGGTAPYLFYPEDESDLAAAVAWLNESGAALPILRKWDECDRVGPGIRRRVDTGEQDEAPARSP